MGSGPPSGASLSFGVVESQVEERSTDPLRGFDWWVSPISPPTRFRLVGVPNFPPSSRAASSIGKQIAVRGKDASRAVDHKLEKWNK